MPQIGWFEILVIVVLAILVIGPKDIPIVLKKIGNWVGYIKRYFSQIQQEVTDVENSIEDELTIDNDISNITKDKNKNE